MKPSTTVSRIRTNFTSCRVKNCIKRSKNALCRGVSSLQLALQCPYRSVMPPTWHAAKLYVVVPTIMRLLTWNVNGLKSVANAVGGLPKLLATLDADIVCFQVSFCGGRTGQEEGFFCSVLKLMVICALNSICCVCRTLLLLQGARVLAALPRLHVRAPGWINSRLDAGLTCDAGCMRTRLILFDHNRNGQETARCFSLQMLVTSAR